MQQVWDTLTAALPLADPVIVFAVVMLIVLLVPIAMRRLRVPAPGLIGLILAGAIVGEHGLNVLERGLAVDLLGHIGLLYLLFTAGLSMDLGQFQRTRARSVGFGLLSFFIPQVMGIAAGLYVLRLDPLAAVLLGSIVGSHTLLAYPIVKRLGITRNRAVTMTMGGTILTDALALSVLAGIVAYQSDGAGMMFWAQFVGLVGLFVIAVVFGLPVLGRWFFRAVRDRTELDFVFLLVVLFIASAVSEWVGLAPIVGAFLAGLTMNRLVPDTGPLMSRVHFVGDALLIPFFLLSVGMLVDFRVLGASAEVWTYAVVFTLLVVIGKGGAAKVAEMIFSLRPHEGWTAAGLTIPQAAATLAVTLIGYQLGIFNEAIVNAIVILILATCLLGPWMVEKFGREVAIAQEHAPIEAAEAPSRVLVPLANPATADALMDLAFMLRGPASNEPIYPLTVARDGPDVQTQVASGEKLLGHAVVHAAAAGVPVLPLTRVDYNVAHGIERAVKERRISMLIIGWNGQVTSRAAVLGSILDQLLESTLQTVLICYTPPSAPPLNTTRRIVVMVPRFAEREPGFNDAMKTTKTLTKEIGAGELVLVTPEVALPRISTLTEGLTPQIDFSSVPVAVGATMLGTIEQELDSDDLILLISSRPGRMSWSSELGRMPHRLATRFPNHNILILYPSELPVLRPIGPAREPRLPLLAASRVHMKLPPAQISEALHQLLRPYFADRLHVLAQVHAELTKNLEQFAMEIAPGIVLLHRHVERIASPNVFIGLCGDGLSVPGVAQPARVLIVLLSPSDLPPEEHLRVLAQIARMMSRENLADQLLKAEKAEDVIELLAPIDPPSVTGG